MRKLILYIAVTLDGFIARKDLSVDFLDSFENAGEDYGYSNFIETIDDIIMGNNTYKQVLTFGTFPYENKNCYVFSRSKKGKDKNVSYINTNIASFINNMKKQKGKNIWLVGGAETVDFCLENNLIDEFIIFNIPIMIGDGISLFKIKANINKRYLDRKLVLTQTKKYKSGIVLTRYKVHKIVN